MFPESNSTKVCEKTTTNESKMNSMDFTDAAASTVTENVEENKDAKTVKHINDMLLKPPAHFRERRNVSPSNITLQDAFPDPLSPSSSSSTSQATSANDTTFEPTIEMMVNDFDDEQTLNEEEAMEEPQDPDEEISTLKEESEMPLDELLAKYRALPPMPPPFIEPPRKKSKKSSSHKKKHKSNPMQEDQTTSPQILNENLEFNTDKLKNTDTQQIGLANDNVMLVKCGHEQQLPDDDNVDKEDKELKSSIILPAKPINLTVEENKDPDRIAPTGGVKHTELVKIRRSHLLDLYPEGTFDNVVKDAISGNGKDIPLETLYSVEDDEDEEIEEEDEEYKKKVMIGTTYQATIPQGLSQYGDILPYENEDKLIWEPSQVSEREVEEYLLKIRDIKSNQQGQNETTTQTQNVEGSTKENRRVENNNENLENNSLLANGDKLQMQSTAISADLENQAVVKDNEQALHLLVQCGYDFKEALRRKRLNALPLNDCMSLWSEEECHKFEEGIQKYGKDFVKIRQHQVRTRTMRELVQFYYLWKKSERRDHNFANADTVDHMDIYLNEDNEYGSNPASVITPVGSPVGGTTSACTSTRRNSNGSQKNISIMTTTNNTINMAGASNLTLDKNCSTATAQQQQHRRRASGNNNCTNNIISSNEFSNENSTNILTTTTTK